MFSVLSSPQSISMLSECLTPHEWGDFHMITSFPGTAQWSAGTKLTVTYSHCCTMSWQHSFPRNDGFAFKFLNSASPPPLWEWSSGFTLKPVYVQDFAIPIKRLLFSLFTSELAIWGTPDTALKCRYIYIFFTFSLWSDFTSFNPFTIRIDRDCYFHWRRCLPLFMLHFVLLLITSEMKVG